MLYSFFVYAILLILYSYRILKTHAIFMIIKKYLYINKIFQVKEKKNG